MDDEGRRAEEKRRRERGAAERAPAGAPGGRAKDDEERDHVRRLQHDRRARVAKALTVLALVVLFVVFIAQNIDTRPTIRFLFLEWDLSVIWIFLAVAFLGGLVGYLLGRPSRRLRLHDKDDKNEHDGKRRDGR